MERVQGQINSGKDSPQQMLHKVKEAEKFKWLERMWLSTAPGVNVGKNQNNNNAGELMDLGEKCGEIRMLNNV